MLDGIEALFPGFALSWSLIRAAGLVAYILLLASVLAGMVAGHRRGGRGGSGLWLSLHDFAAFLGLLFGLLHGLTLLVDPVVPYALGEILVPGLATYEPAASALGTLALWGSLALLLAFDLRGWLSAVTWRVIHVVAPLVLLLASLHGLWIGTDAGSLWVRALLGSGAMVAIGAVPGSLRVAFRQAGGGDCAAIRAGRGRDAGATAPGGRRSDPERPAGSRASRRRVPR